MSVPPRGDTLHKIFCFLALPCCLVFAGCADRSSSPAPAASPVATVNSEKAASASPVGSHLSVPRLEPNPVVWLADRRDAETMPPAREEAQGWLSLADQLKASKKFADAEKAYQQAMTADPTWAYPAYQLACNYELWGQHDRAVTTYAHAMDLGFDDFPTALVDDELGQIRDGADFPKTLAAIRQRYLESSASRAGQPIAIRPSGEQPASGWPMMMMLHGYGDTNLNYLDFAQDWADLGFVAVAVPGSVPARSGHYQWAMESTEPTDQDLQAIMKSPLFDGLVNRDQVFLLGFSQGALHAMLLAAEQPDRYAGVVSLSPGGSLAGRLAPPPLNTTQRPGRCYFIHGEEEPHAPYVRIWSQACQDSGWKFASATHPGGHHFPEDWDAMQPKIAAFLKESLP